MITKTMRCRKATEEESQEGQYTIESSIALADLEDSIVNGHKVIQVCETKVILEDLVGTDDGQDVSYEIYEGSEKHMRKLVRKAKASLAADKYIVTA